jgi:hypothetical protein
MRPGASSIVIPVGDEIGEHRPDPLMLVLHAREACRVVDIAALEARALRIGAERRVKATPLAGLSFTNFVPMILSGAIPFSTIGYPVSPVAAAPAEHANRFTVASADEPILIVLDLMHPEWSARRR